VPVREHFLAADHVSIPGIKPAPIAAYRPACCDPVSGMPRVLSDAIVTSSPDTHLTLVTTP
jgi:hypothetical protein